jgi:Fe-S cluster assembly scaffold protein SufB
MNKSIFSMDVKAAHQKENVRIASKIKVVAHKDSETSLSGHADIPPNAENAESDIGFSALCAPDIKSIKFTPTQTIMAGPRDASHSASIWRARPPQVEYLRGAGLSAAETDAALQEAFLEDWPNSDILQKT